MKKIIIFILFLFSLSHFAEINAVCTLPWIKNILSEIGSDKIQVSSLVKPDEDPHYVEPKPSMLIVVRKADILFYNGLDLEIGYLPRIIESSNNPKVQPGREGNVDLSQFLKPIEKPSSYDRSMGDVHPLGNPHYYYSPQNIKEVAKGITKILSKMDLSNSDFYRKNLENFLQKVSIKEEEWKKLNLKDKKIITYHKFLNYLSNEYDFQIVTEIEPKPGIPPSAKYLSTLLEILKTNKINLIIITNVVGEKEANYLSQKSGVKVKIVAIDVGGKEEAKDLISLIDSILKAVGEA